MGVGGRVTSGAGWVLLAGLGDSSSHAADESIEECNDGMPVR